ncbi:DNA-binding MarR family transcriptional regulator [Kitasatospora sp. SolWspMP-SS2h]|uniref:MarR family winged helix-turn-helix transcriptional regulator n=1 Tax=Kitasatospora TaxID=2063 RepID=UPI000C2BE9C6|nr:MULTISPECIES: MarR family transcriptional regulator [Kitasatospora]RAJ45570.1 DNA-binding MarR family transcriptional regulator [Kitasatospora sp. SolWspMP-SS2h]
MSPFSALPGPGDAAQTASSVVELLEILWGGGRDLATAPLSASQLRVMYVLERQDGINLRTLTEALDSTPSSASRLCDRLEAVGFLDRAPSTTSRRELELRLSGRGLAFLAELRARRERQIGAVLDAMPPAERKALVRGLESFQDVLAGTVRPPALGVAGSPSATRSA